MRSSGVNAQGARGGNRVSPARPSRRRGRRYDARPPAGCARPPLAALHPHGRLSRRRGADHRSRRRLLPRGRERQALSRRSRRPLLRQPRLRLRRGDRAGGARADEGAAVLHELVVRAPARDRARDRARLARAGRPQPRVLRLGRLGGGRVGVEARTPVLPRPRRQGAALQVQGGRARGRVPRHDVRRALDQRDPGDPAPVRAAGARGAAREEHEPLPPPAGGDRGRVHADAAREPRADDPRVGAGDGVPRAHGAGAERRRGVHAARGLLARRARALRPVRHPALGRRGDHGLRPRRPLVRVRALRHPAGHRLLREGALVLLRRDRRGAGDRPRHAALSREHGDVLARDHLRRPSGHVRRSR